MTRRALNGRYEVVVFFDLLELFNVLIFIVIFQGVMVFSPTYLTWSTLMQGTLWDVPFLEHSLYTTVVAFLLNISL